MSVHLSACLSVCLSIRPTHTKRFEIPKYALRMHVTEITMSMVSWGQILQSWIWGFSPLKRGTPPVDIENLTDNSRYRPIGSKRCKISYEVRSSEVLSYYYSLIGTKSRVSWPWTAYWLYILRYFSEFVGQ